MSATIKKLETLFWEAKQLDPGEDRERFIDQIAAQDANLAEEVRRLLMQDAKSDQVFGGLSALDETRDSVAELGASGGSLSSVRAGSKIGPYKLLEPIGEGGMGLVYLAQQSEPVRRKVALKIIKPGMDSRQVVARFEAERQALAMMDHPNIAKVLDAGATESGLPYFVMELVRGIPMTEYCDRAKMPTRARLELFTSACNAIQHAHNKGVIHRDIKPSNVLVTEQDGKPLLKVIDFGVAKALTDNLTDKTLFTGMFQMMGTPLYMSPEQASLSNVDVDTRSDVYSLGVMLYELLSGSLPIDREEVKELSLDQLRQRICDTEPPRPSKRLSTLKDERETVAERRGIDVSRVHQLVTSELDWIVMRSIEKDRNRRYQSAREFAEDIQRYLDGDAVEACPPSFRYRAKKYVLRNRYLLSTAAIILVALMAGLSVALWQRSAAITAKNEALKRQELAENNLGSAVKAIDQLLGGLNGTEGASIPRNSPLRSRLYDSAIELYDQVAADNDLTDEASVRRARMLFDAADNAYQTNELSQFFAYRAQLVELLEDSDFPEPHRSVLRAATLASRSFYDATDTETLGARTTEAIGVIREVLREYGSVKAILKQNPDVLPDVILVMFQLTEGYDVTHRFVDSSDWLSIRDWAVALIDTAPQAPVVDGIAVRASHISHVYDRDSETTATLFATTLSMRNAIWKRIFSEALRSRVAPKDFDRAFDQQMRLLQEEKARYPELDRTHFNAMQVDFVNHLEGKAELNHHFEKIQSEDSMLHPCGRRYLAMGMIQKRLGNSQDACDFLRTAYSLERGIFNRVFQELLVCLTELGEYEDVIDIIEKQKVIGLDVRMIIAESFYIFAIDHGRLTGFDHCIDQLRLILEQDPKFTEVFCFKRLATDRIARECDNESFKHELLQLASKWFHHPNLESDCRSFIVRAVWNLGFRDRAKELASDLENHSANENEDDSDHAVTASAESVFAYVRRQHAQAHYFLANELGYEEHYNQCIEQLRLAHEVDPYPMVFYSDNLSAELVGRECNNVQFKRDLLVLAEDWWTDPRAGQDDRETIMCAIWDWGFKDRSLELFAEHQQSLSPDAPRQRNVLLSRILLSFLETGRTELAIETLQRELDIDENTMEVLGSLPISFFRDAQGEFGKFVLDFLNSTELNRAEPDALRVRAQIEIALAEFDSAAGSMRAFVERDPEATGYYHYQAALLCLLAAKPDEYEEICTSMWEKYSDADKTEDVSWMFWTLSLSTQADEIYPAATLLAKRLLKEHPDDFKLQRYIAAYLVRAGQAEIAMSILQESVESSDPTTSPTYYQFFLAIAHAKVGDQDKARDWFHRGAESVEAAFAAEASGDKTLAWNRKATLEMLRADAESVIAEK